MVWPPVQIGVPLRLAVVDCSDAPRAGGDADGEPRNEVLHASAIQLREHEEASPNLPGVSAVIARPRAVTVRFLNAEGCGRGSGFRRSLGDVGAASDRPSGREDVFRPPLAVEAEDADRQGRKAKAREMKIIFMGTPDFSVPVLDALHQAHEIVAVYCQPPRPAGRGKADRPSPVQTRARRWVCRCGTRSRCAAKSAAKDFAALGADVAVVVAYGLILPQEILDAPRFGCLNIHASLLPRWRGAAPIHRAIMAGDRETGVCIMQMEAGLDTGPVLLRESLPIGAEETTAELHDRLKRPWRAADRARRWTACRLPADAAARRA
jgi:folate-dependent phosphoribosylglycinamide formyltransferase PurN